MTATALKIKTVDKPQLQPNCRVLVVEDEPAIAAAYRDILNPEPSANVTQMKRSSRRASTPLSEPSNFVQGEFSITVVNSASAALAEVQTAIAKGEPFAMGFFDVLLGQGMDGIDLVKKIFELDSEMIAVFVTAYSDRTVQSIQELLGADQSSRWDYLNKPFTQGEILQKARTNVSLWNLRAEKVRQDEQVQELQRRLIENERLSSVAAVSRGVGHEFGNILTQILGKAELSRNRSEVEMRQALEQILAASYRAADILDRFKDLARPAREQARKNLVLLDQPVSEMLELLSHQLKTANVKVCRLKTDKVMVQADQTALLQVLVNLVLNSVHAMPHSGQIDISIVKVDGYGEIHLRDYGVGVDPKILPHITDAFFTTKGAKGTGLGLAISKEIIEIEHEGEFILRNHEVKGFEAVIRIPAGGEEKDATR